MAGFDIREAPGRVTPGIHFATQRIREWHGDIVKRVLLPGAGGRIARWVIEMLAGSKDIELALYLRPASKPHGTLPQNVTLVEGDVLDSGYEMSIVATLKYTLYSTQRPTNQ
jgi:hypothetical protein